MSDLIREVVVTPAFSRRDPDPKKDYGIGACRIWFYLKGPLGVIQFQIGTDWFLPSDQRAQRQGNYERASRYDEIQPSGWDIGYHSPKPMYEGQSPMDSCTVLDGDCYYDGSSLQADEMIPQFLAGGTDWLWPELERRYHEEFSQETS